MTKKLTIKQQIRGLKMKKQKLLKILDEKVSCIKGCHECCGLVPFSDEERKSIPEELKKDLHWMEFGDSYKVPQPADGSLNCAFLKKDDGNKQCKIYEYRPFVCKAFGRMEGLTCSFGANTKTLIKRKDVGKFDKELGMSLMKEEKKLLAEVVKRFI